MHNVLYPLQDTRDTKKANKQNQYIFVQIRGKIYIFVTIERVATIGKERISLFLGLEKRRDIYYRYI
jgi:hypothetical protein